MRLTDSERMIWAAAALVGNHHPDYSSAEVWDPAVWAAYSAVLAFRAVDPVDDQGRMYLSFRGRKK